MTGHPIPVVAANSGKGSTVAPSALVAAADPGGYSTAAPPGSVSDPSLLALLSGESALHLDPREGSGALSLALPVSLPTNPCDVFPSLCGAVLCTVVPPFPLCGGLTVRDDAGSSEVGGTQLSGEGGNTPPPRPPLLPVFPADVGDDAPLSHVPTPCVYVSGPSSLRLSPPAPFVASLDSPSDVMMEDFYNVPSPCFLDSAEECDPLP